MSFKFKLNNVKQDYNIGAWMYDSSVQRVPLKCSGNLVESDANHLVENDYSYNYHNIDDAWMVLPGYKLIVCTGVSGAGTQYTLDNTDGSTTLFRSLGTTVPDFVKSPNTIRSVLLYYRGVYVPHSGNV